MAAAELLSQPLIQREPGSGSRRCLERSLERLGLAAARLNVALELGSGEAVREAVLERVGVAVLSRRAVEREVNAGQLRALAVEGLTLDREICVVRDRGRALPAAAQLFLDVIRPEPEDAAAGATPP